jgi:NAD(P)-dependent dehydrogenase (short-subunit alcohol dehydrogenase family)
VKTFQGKRVVLTGAASGIGRALALVLAREDARLVLVDLDEAGLAETVRLTGRPDVRAQRLDVSDRAGVEALAEEVGRALGGADVLINNAGISSAGRVRDLQLQTLAATMAVNFWGVVYTTQAFLPQLLARPDAALVNVSSVFGLMGVPGQAAYCASKFAVRGFTEALRHEVRGTGLRVTVVYPGGVRTQIAARSRVDFPVAAEVLVEAQREWEREVTGSPDRAAEQILAGVRAGRSRVLIGGDARIIDRVARWLPERHAWFVDRFLRRGAIWRALDSLDSLGADDAARGR